MWLIGLRDLQWRLRRFLIGMLATALVFAITLLLSGLTASLHNEPRRIVHAIGADAWVVPAGVSGPFTSTQPIAIALLAGVASGPGVHEAAAVLLARATVRLPALSDVNVVGYQVGKLGAPRVRNGRSIAHDGELVVDASLGADVSGRLKLGKGTFTIVGTTRGMTYFGGTPVVFMTLHDAQVLLYDGAPVATAIVTKGTPRGLAPDVAVLSNAQVLDDLRRPVDVGAQTIGFLDVLLWAVAAGIIGAILYMSALERVRDFAVLKAIGASNRYVMTALAMQAVILAITAAAAAMLLAALLSPVFPMPVEIPPIAYPALLVIALVVGLLASAAGLRRAVRVDPASAFGG
jgi:putative ABC transport system permease protein